jgi:medium-chain acyl-[acyl-carrier-protein] hydrolase
MIPGPRSPWLPLLDRLPDSVTRLFCFPHAGGSAQMYRSWQQQLGPGCVVCAVQPPGRWNRFMEPAISDLPLLVDSAVEGLQRYLGDSLALFGHSVGALVEFEFARRLRSRGLAGPRHLFVSGRRAPHLPGVEPSIDQLSDDALIALVCERYEAIPKQVLNDPGMRSVIIPLLRSDLKLDQRYKYMPEPPLPCPITVFGGESDRTASLASLEAWGEHTSANFNVHTFPGGHFFLDQQRDRVLHVVQQYLS